MKTIPLPTDLHRQAKACAAARGQTLAQFAEGAVRREVSVSAPVNVSQLNETKR